MQMEHLALPVVPPSPSAVHSFSTAEFERRAARVLFWIAFPACALQIGFGFRWGFALAWMLLPVLGAGLALACLRLPPSVQIKVSMSLISFFLTMYGIEVCLMLLVTTPEDAALAAGRPYDGRNSYEVVQDLRSHGEDAYPAVQPALIYPLKPEGLLIQGKKVLPLAGISDRVTVWCNEGGTHTVYRSDEHGFNNPKGIWTRVPLDIAVVGDSFVQGGCVAPEENVVARIRQHYPATLNLGMGGSGPLIELAQLLEYLPSLRPHIVLWLFYENDLDDLRHEEQVPVLRSYLDPAFRQGLLGEQAEIDAAIHTFVDEAPKPARRAWPAMQVWPAWLNSISLPRERCPLWIQDLVLGQDYTTTARILQLRLLHRTARDGWLAARKPAEPTLSVSETRENENLLGRILQEASSAVASWGGKLYVVYLPSYVQVSKEGKLPVRRTILDLCGSIGLPALDLYPAFAAQPLPRTLFPFPGAHYNEQGYSVAAQAILLYLDQQASKKADGN
jgi:hypothetical protein